jgi:hypothetical protein
MVIWRRNPPEAVTPDSDPGSSPDSRVRGNEGFDIRIRNQINETEHQGDNSWLPRPSVGEGQAEGPFVLRLYPN